MGLQGLGMSSPYIQHPPILASQEQLALNGLIENDLINMKHQEITKFQIHPKKTQEEAYFSVSNYDLIFYRYEKDTWCIYCLTYIII